MTKELPLIVNFKLICRRLLPTTDKFLGRHVKTDVSKLLKSKITSDPRSSEDSRAYTKLVSQDLLEAAGENKFRERSNVVKTSRNEKTSRRGFDLKVDGEVLFGISPVLMALDAGRRSFNQLFLNKSVDKLNNSRMMCLKQRANDLEIPVVKVPTFILDQLSGGRPHQGVCLDSGRLMMEKYDDIQSTDNELSKKKQLWILLDKVQDPMNLGAILRSSYYFGVDRILTTSSCCSLTPIVSKASSGAMELMRLYQVDNVIKFLENKVSNGWFIFGTASCPAMNENKSAVSKFIDLRDIKWPNSTILLLGNEGRGISKELFEYCQSIVYISSSAEIHPSLESLNVSVATGIILQNFSFSSRDLTLRSC